MATRYSGNALTSTSTDNNSLKEVIESRGRKFIDHYSTANLVYPTVEQIQTLNFINHTWKAGDKYWKLSSTYYGSPKYWWIIAWYNKKPIEASLNVGDTLQIPQPLGDLLGMIG